MNNSTLPAAATTEPNLISRAYSLIGLAYPHLSPSDQADASAWSREVEEYNGHHEVVASGTSTELSRIKSVNSDLWALLLSVLIVVTFWVVMGWVR